MIKKILKTIILVGPTILPMGLLLDAFHSSRAIFGLVALVPCIYFLLSIWKRNVILKIPAFLRGILLVLSFLVWLPCLGLSFFALTFNPRCVACDEGYINPIISENNVVLDLSIGKELRKYDKDGWQSCGCRKVVSFEKNPDYAIKQISLMDNYWTEYTNCQDFLESYSVYANEVDYSVEGPCYAHVQTLKDSDDDYEASDIVIVYDQKTNHLFYHFYHP